MSNMFAALMRCPSMLDGFSPEPVIEPAKEKPVRIALPWGLTPGEMASIEAVAETGSGAAAAKKLGLSVRTVECRVSACCKKMGVENRTLAVLAFARWQWEQAA